MMELWRHESGVVPHISHAVEALPVGDDLGMLGADRCQVGCSKMVRTRVDTYGWPDFGTLGADPED